MANTNQFTINLGANLVTDDVPKQIQKLNAQLVNSTNTKIKIPVGVDPNGEKQFDNLIKQVNTYKDSYGNLYKQVLKFKELQQTLADGSKVGTGNFQLISDPNDSLTKVTSKINNLTTEINKWTDSKGNINTWTTAVDDAGRRITTRVKESINDLGEITTETSKWGQKTVEVNGKIKSVYGQIGDATKTTKQLVQEMTTTTTSQVGQINDLGKSYQGLITTTEKVGTNGEYLKTVISEYTDATGRAVKVTEQFNKAGNKVATTMRKVSDIPKNNTTTSTFIKANGTKIVTEYANGMAVLKTVTKEYTNALGALIKETSVYDEQTHKLISTHKEELNNQKERLDKIAQEQQYRQQLTTITRENEQVIQRAGVSYKAIVKTIREQTHDYGLLTTTITTYKNALGETVVETQKVDANGKHVAQSTRTITKELDNASNSAKRYAQSVKSVNNSSQTLGSALSRAFSRLTNYYVAMLPIRAFQKSITETVSTIKNFDAAITEMGKVTDYNGDKLKKYTRDLADLGTEVARTQTEMTEAATGWLKAGYSEEDAALLSKYSALLQNTADEELSAAEATSILVSQLKAYHMEANEAIKITDIINKVSANQAVSSYDISQGLTMASAAMATFGNNIEQTTALLTAGTTIFQGRSKQVARGLNMIATRVAKNGEALKEYGVDINNANGDLRSTYEILVDLAPAWNKMSKAEQVALGNTLAGTNQYKILAAIMSQMDVAVESYNQALDANGETMKQNAVYMSGLEAKTTALKAEFEKIVISRGGLQDFAKALVEIGTSALKLINNLGGLPSILTVILGLLISINLIKIGGWITSVIEGVKNLIYSLTRAVSALRLYRTGWITTTQAMQASIPIVGLIITALSLLTAGIMAHNKKVEEQKEKIKENIAIFAEEYATIDNTIKKLKDENISREELNNIIDSNLDEYDAERLKLQDVNEARKETIKLLEEEKKAKAQELVDTGLTEYEEALKRIEGGYSEVGDFITEAFNIGSNLSEVSIAMNISGLPYAKTATEQKKALISFKNEIISLRNECEKGSYDWTKYNNILKETEATMNTVSESYSADTKIVKDFQNALDITGQHYNSYTGQVVSGSSKSAIAIEEERKGKAALAEQNKLSSDELKLLQEQYGITEEAILNYIEANEEENITREQAIEQLAVEAEANIQSGKTVEALAETHGIAADKLKEWAKELDTSEESLVANADAMHLTVEEYYNYAKAVKEARDAISSTNSAIDGLQDALQKAQTALDEYNEKGYLTLDTFQDLMSVSSEYLVSLVNEEGQLEINQQTLGNLVEVLKQNKIEELQLAEVNDILAYAYGDVEKLSGLAQTAISGAGNAAQTAGRQAQEGSSGFWSMAEAMSAANAAATGEILDTTHIEANLQKIHNAYSNLASSISKTYVNTTRAANAAKSAGKAGASAAKQANDATKDLNKTLEDTKSKYEKVISWISKQYDKEIDNIKKAKDEAIKAEEAKIKAKEKQKDKALNAIEAEIKALEKEKDARKKYWDEQIDALKKANDERKDALELQEKLDALERAKNTKVKVYKEGQGFVYDVDQTAVAEAQKALDEYLSEKAYEDELARLEALRDAEMDNYEQRLDALNEYKDRVQESYEKQIEALNEHKEQLEAQYDAEIELYENYKQQFEDMVNAYEEEQTRLLAQQLTGIDFENKNWMTRLDNLAKFVNEYNNLQKQLNTGTTDAKNTAQLSNGGGLPSGSDKGKTSTPQYDDRGFRLNEGYTNANGKITNTNRWGTTLDVINKANKHASGIGSISSDEIAVVGENPNQEIVIGSKINNGQLMSLGKGTGVVNANSSKTLASMLNQVCQFGASGFGSGNGTLNSNINNDSLTINGVTIQGANINDPQTFVNGLLNLKAEALQRAYRHR